MSVVVYSKPDCAQCVQTKKYLAKKGIDFSEVDMSVDADALEKVKALGYRAAPVVIAGDEHWSGFNMAKLNSLSAK